MRKFINRFGAANTVTVARILLIPIFLVILLTKWPSLPLFDALGLTSELWQPLIGAAIFGLIAATDAVDGYLARSRNEVTTFGKLVDPLADKLLVTAALLALVQLQSIPAWVAFIIISREFVVSGLRMVNAVEGVVVQASVLGKIKTVLQIVAIVAVILSNSSLASLISPLADTIFWYLAQSILGAAVIATIWSMIDYFIKASDVLGRAWKK